MEFAGRITAIDNKRDEENVNEGTLIELVDYQPDSTVGISFNDRNERCYVTFKLTDLMAALAEFAGVSKS